MEDNVKESRVVLTIVIPLIIMVKLLENINTLFIIEEENAILKEKDITKNKKTHFKYFNVNKYMCLV